jgi:hypothetical protein
MVTLGPQMQQLEETVTAGLKQFGWGLQKCTGGKPSALSRLLGWLK